MTSMLALVLLAFPTPAINTQPVKVHHKTVKVGDLDIFYREAGPKDAPAILLLHGFPTSSQMFRNLIPALADKYRVIAPDYPGFGHSSMPPRDKFAYTFDNLAEVIDKFTEKVGLKKYALYVQDYGAPVGYRLAVASTRSGSRPSWCRTATPTTRGSTTTSGSRSRRTGRSRRARRSARRCGRSRNYDATKWQYTHGVKNPELVSARTARPTTSSCSTARGTTRSSSTCS